MPGPDENPKGKGQEPTTNTAAPNTFTDEEKQLAEKYKVEPKLVRMIAEIVEERLKRLNECIEQLQILNKNIDERLAAPEETTSEPEQEDESSEGDKQEPTTGIPQLDKFIKEATYESQAMSYCCLDLCQRDESLGDRITTVLESSVRLLLEDKVLERADFKGADFECDIAPATKWLRFVDGFQAGLKSTQSVDQPASTEPKPEGDPTLFAVKKWLNKRSYAEKLTAVLVGKLIEVESIYEEPDNLIGNNFSKQFEDEVLEASMNEMYLKQAPPDEIAVSAFVLALMPVRV